MSQMQCPRCGARVLPSDVRCLECGFGLPGRCERIGQGGASTRPQGGGHTTEAFVVVDCPRRGCSGRIRVPTTVGPEGVTICPLCRRSFLFAVGRVRTRESRDLDPRDETTQWELHFDGPGEAPEEGHITFRGHRHIVVQPGDEFVCVQEREGEHTAFHNLTVEGAWQVRPPAGCFPLLALGLLACCCLGFAQMA